MHKRMILMIAGFLLLNIVCILLNACATVKPYEREFLADRIMNFDANAEEIALERHFLLTREGSMGGYGGAGGGCACN